MQKHISTGSSSLLFILVIALVVLTTVGSCLYTENRNYKEANRELIIQNDSIISANIRLQAALKANNKTVSKNLVRLHKR